MFKTAGEVAKSALGELFLLKTAGQIDNYTFRDTVKSIVKIASSSGSNAINSVYDNSLVRGDYIKKIVPDLDNRKITPNTSQKELLDVLNDVLGTTYTAGEHPGVSVGRINHPNTHTKIIKNKIDQRKAKAQKAQSTQQYPIANYDNPKKSLFSRIGGHFKDHWKGYTALGGGLAGAGLLANYLLSKNSTDDIA